MRSNNVLVRVQTLLSFIQSEQPTQEQILYKIYKSASPAAIRKLQRDIKQLNEEHDIAVDEDGRYALVHSAITKSVLEVVFNDKERQLLRRLQQEFSPGHPFQMDLQILLDKLAGRIGQQQEQLQRSAPVSYFGTRLTRDYTLYRDLLDQLDEAIRYYRRVKFVYLRPVSRDIRNVPHLEVEPQYLELRNGTFYLYGYNLYKQRGYHYRVDKIADLKILPDKFAGFRNPAADMIEFEYVLTPNVVKGGISERFYFQEVIAMLPDGSARLRARDDEFWVRQELLRMGRTARLVNGPPSLISELQAEAEYLWQNYGPQTNTDQ